MNGTALSLSDLERFDPQAPDRDRNERRFLCPLPGCDGKPATSEHRSLSVNKETHEWQCFRCHTGGLLTDFREPSHPTGRRERARGALRRAFAVPAPPAPAAANTEWRAALAGLAPLVGSAGERYLQQRGIPLAVSLGACVKYSPDWYGRAGVVFPVRDRQGRLLAAQVRYIGANVSPKTRSAGPISAGAFATAGAWEAEALIITEAPIDALTLATAGYPALAVMGSGIREWITRYAALRHVLIATDADEAGDRAAAGWTAALSPLGARVRRLRPVGAKDWNEMLISTGAEGLRESIRTADGR